MSDALTTEAEREAERDRLWWARFWAHREAIQRESRRSSGVYDD